MARIRILSGSQAGAVVEMDGPEAQSAIDTGFGEPEHKNPHPLFVGEVPEEPKESGQEKAKAKSKAKAKATGG